MASSGNIIILEDDDHHDDLVEKEGLHKRVVVYIFSAPWCGPCKIFKPKWEKIAKEYSSTKFVYVNLDDCASLADTYGITSIPSVRIYKPGNKVNIFEVKADEHELRKNLDIALQ